MLLLQTERSIKELWIQRPLAGG